MGLPVQAPSQAQPAGESLRLQESSRVAVIGGGPAGSFFSLFLLQMTESLGFVPQVDIYEPRDFTQPGPQGCNMCGGIISETLVQSLAAEGITLRKTVVQRSIDSYYLHMDVGSVRIETPLHEKRIAAVHRGGGPRGARMQGRSFDRYLLELSMEKGARHVQERVDAVKWMDGRPQVSSQRGTLASYDLLVVACGINSSLLKSFEQLGLAYQPPKSTKAYICEYYLGKEMIQLYLGSAMHVFLLNLPRLEFAAIIPKGEYVTVCLLGHNIDKPLVEAFLNRPEVKECLPPNWQAPDEFCHCSPKLNVASAVRPFADRVVFVGDSGATRLYKDGIGAAYRTAKAAAKTAAFEGIAARDFQRHYWPACKGISTDNQLGRLVFWVTREIQKRRYARRGLLRMVYSEQRLQDGLQRRMSGVLWDTFTGSAPYRSVLLRSLHPAFLIRLAAEILTSNWPQRKKGEKKIMITGMLGTLYRDGEIIVRQNEPGDCMYVIQAGEVELLRREGDKEFCLGVLKEGNFFGEMALFGQETRAETVRALGDAVIVLTLEKKSFLRRIHEDPSLAFRILQKMSQRVRELEAKLIRMGDTA